jgi:hypothetical protein
MKPHLGSTTSHLPQFPSCKAVAVMAPLLWVCFENEMTQSLNAFGRAAAHQRHLVVFGIAELIVFLGPGLWNGGPAPWEPRRNARSP